MLHTSHLFFIFRIEIKSIKNKKMKNHFIFLSKDYQVIVLAPLLAEFL